MAGDWVKWEIGLENKPEVVRMAGLLKRSRREVAADCMALWAWADGNIPEENISENGSAFVTLSPSAGDNMAFIDDVVGTPQFAHSISSVGWLHFRHDRVEFPNFGRHNGETAKTRARNAKNQKKKRSKPAPQKSKPTAVEEVNESSPVTNLSPSSGDISVTRGEERRGISSNEEIHPPNPPVGGNVAVVSLVIGKEVITYDQDHIRWQAEFIRRWNKLPGVSRHTNQALSTSNVRLLIQRLSESDWHWQQAFLKFPLWTPSPDWMPTLSWFLEPPSVSKILEGRYERRTEQAGLFDRGGADQPGRVRTGKTGDAIADAMAEAAAARSG